MRTVERTIGRRREPRSYRRLRVALADGARTTLHVASYEPRAYPPRVVALSQPQPLLRWCRAEGVSDAVVGGFFVRPGGRPLGELRVGGVPLPSSAVLAPWDRTRACVSIEDGRVVLARRDQLAAAPDGDLLQAGPLLVRDGERIVGGDDDEGFAAGARQFDSDITAGRYPRAALALAGRHVLAVACDGRCGRDAGMTLGELADALIALGASAAINLDGGGSASLVNDGRLRNRPREQHGIDLLEGRPIATAIVFGARSMRAECVASG